MGDVSVQILQQLRNERAQRWTERMNRRQRAKTEARERRLERFGLDVAGAPAEVADARRVMRNARKRERQLAR